MANRARGAVAPVYLLLCLFLGGSAQGAWQNALLQLGGIAIIGWAALASTEEAELSGRAKMLLLLAVAAIAVVAIQAVPLPSSFWTHGVRARIAKDDALLGLALPWLPISLTPYESSAALLSLIPPLAMFVAIVRLSAFRPTWLAAALFAGSIAGVVLGGVQVASAQPTSRWYLYSETNFGSAVGFFANANHMASLLLLTLPFLAAVAASGRRQDRQRYSALLSGLAALALVLIAGIALNGSLAGYSLALPVLAGSTLVFLRRRSVGWRLAIAVAMLSVIGAAIALASSSAAPTGKIGQSANTAVQSRAVILKTTAKAIADAMPLGSGLGSFRRVYPLYESPDAVTSEYVIHAHNDFAELALELGAPGIILILLFLGWWARAVWTVWRKGSGDPFARAASIASAAVLIHSLVDFPLRTAAISASFAMCLGLLAVLRPPPPREPAELRPTRHILFK